MTSSYALPYSFILFLQTFLLHFLLLLATHLRIWTFEFYRNDNVSIFSLMMKKNHNFIHGEQNHEEKMQKFVSLIWKVCQRGMYFFLGPTFSCSPQFFIKIPSFYPLFANNFFISTWDLSRGNEAGLFSLSSAL